MTKSKTRRYSREQILGLPQLFRNNLINSVSGYKSANLVGTHDQERGPNLAIFSSVTHFGSNPPLLGFVMRPTTVPRNTYENIKDTGWYTINHIHRAWTGKAHQTSAKYEEGIDEFEVCGFKKEWTDHPAPYVKEASIKMGMQFLEEHHIKSNGTILVLGSIQELIFDESHQHVDGFLDLQEAGTVAINGLDAYVFPEKVARYHYARPGMQTKEMI